MGVCVKGQPPDITSEVPPLVVWYFSVQLCPYYIYMYVVCIGNYATCSIVGIHD